MGGSPSGDAADSGGLGEPKASTPQPTERKGKGVSFEWWVGGVRCSRARLGPTAVRLRHTGLALETCQGGPGGVGSIPTLTTQRIPLFPFFSHLGRAPLFGSQGPRFLLAGVLFVFCSSFPFTFPFLNLNVSEGLTVCFCYDTTWGWTRIT